MASKKINVTELDFDNIKQNLKTFLQGQSVFQDYDFEGSGLSVLLDVLAYNTHYNALYNNMSINEMFLDSARKRNSVVSLAKSLGYTPRSAACSKAIVDVTLRSNTPTQFVLDKGTPFSAALNGTTYTFYTTSAHTTTTVSTEYTFTDVEIMESASTLTHNYTVADGTRYVLPNQNIDISTLKITNQLINSSTTTSYTLASNITNIDSTSNVYWVKEIDDGLYELTFGDSILGTAPENGSIISVEYSISSLDSANGIKVFNLSGTLSGVSSYNVSLKSQSSGGAYPEDIESIRFNAPKFYQSQNRTVTSEDYKTCIYANVPYAESVSVWGGEDNVPPIYGKTFACIKPYNADVLTAQQKDDVINSILKPKSVLGMIPEILDPEYINVVLETNVYYNELETTRSATDIATIVKDAIINYDNSELQRFDKILRYSKLSKLIDNSEPSIINNIMTVILKRSVTPKYNVDANYTINLLNPIYYSGVPEDMVLSSGFYIQGDSKLHYLVDDGNGNMQLFYYEFDNRIIKNSSIGTVDYNSGIIKINGLKITSIYGNDFYFTIKPQSNDVASIFTQIVRISQTDLVVTATPDATLNGDFRGGTNYKFTTSRT